MTVFEHEQFLNVRALRLQVHDQVKFGSVHGRWDVVGESRDGRFVLVVNRVWEAYQVLDLDAYLRGGLQGAPPAPLWKSMGRQRPESFAFFNVNYWDEEVDMILARLEDGEGLGLDRLGPLWVSEHWSSVLRGPVLRADRMSDWAARRCVRWLEANGCRWRMSPSAVVYIKGRNIEVDTWTIRNPRQARTLWPKRLPDDWEPPTRTRRFRIRVPLSTTRKD